MIPHPVIDDLLQSYRNNSDFIHVCYGDVQLSKLSIDGGGQGYFFCHRVQVAWQRAKVEYINHD